MTASRISEVIIIYNPNSTGDGETNARHLCDQLRQASPNLTVKVTQTKYAGHAEKIARQYAKRTQTTLLISSSGDGGYHELINGVILSDAKNIITSLLPSGNANDHFRAIGKKPIVQDVLSHKTRHIDLLKVTSVIDGKPWVRYAHSYAGIGLTPVIGKKLTKAKLNVFNEKWLLIKELFEYNYVSVLINGTKKKYSSLTFSNISHMAKFVQVSKKSSVTDGKFEVNTVPYQSKFRVLAELVKATTIGAEQKSSESEFEFKTIKPLLMQLDGEVYPIDANSTVKIQSIHKALTII